MAHHDYPECRVECKAEFERLGTIAAEAEAKASEAVRVAGDAALKTGTVEVKFKVIIAMLAALSTIVLGVVGWLVLQIQQADHRARETAEIVAEKAVLSADRRIEARLKLQTIEAIREYRRQEQAEIDRLVGKAAR